MFLKLFPIILITISEMTNVKAQMFFTYNETCSSTADCNISRGLECSGGVCLCANLDAKRWLIATQECVDRVSVHDPCLVNGDCYENKGLECIGGMCLCANPTVNYWDLIKSVCVGRSYSSFEEPCSDTNCLPSSDNDCLPLSGLFCDFNDSLNLDGKEVGKCRCPMSTLVFFF
jgi:hypothetical protein